jgi:hypothetical protein
MTIILFNLLTNGAFLPRASQIVGQDMERKRMPGMAALRFLHGARHKNVMFFNVFQICDRGWSGLRDQRSLFSFG